jgi:voltage-gated potassium channel
MVYLRGMVQRLKRRAYEILEATDPEDALGRWVNFFIMALILLNVAAVVLESEKSIDAKYGPLFDAFGLFSIVAFTIEYTLRLWVSDLVPGRQDPIGGRVKFALSPLALVDLAVILPYYLPMVFPDLRFLRGVRIFWLFRLLEVERYSESMGTLERVVRAKKEELMVTFFAIVFFLTVASSIIYFLEHDAQPENFPSIPATMWWGLLTLTTIGYGNVYPVTTLGKIVGSLIIILGVGMFALPTGILASGFVEEIQSRAKLRAERAEDAANGSLEKKRQTRSERGGPRSDDGGRS